jgi:glycosyl-4,4'-diaponeurosporenoate acyltransferase
MMRDKVRQLTILESTERGLLPWWERLLDWWFAPKAFESTALYERLGVRLIKRYAPTGGDFVIRRYGIRIADVRGNLDALIQYERLTRRLEAIHEIAFLGFLTWSLWRAVKRRTTFIDLGIALVVYLSLILSPAMLQRYNRLRVDPVIRRMAARPTRARAWYAL